MGNRWWINNGKDVEHQPNIGPWLNFSHSKFFRTPAVKFIIWPYRRRARALVRLSLHKPPRDRHTSDCLMTFTTAWQWLMVAAAGEQSTLRTGRNCFQSQMHNVRSCVHRVVNKRSGSKRAQQRTWQTCKRWSAVKIIFVSSHKSVQSRVMRKRSGERGGEKTTNGTKYPQNISQMDGKICLISLSLMSVLNGCKR